MKSFSLVVLLIIVIISCTKNSDDKSVVTGTWVEATQGKDTIKFVNSAPDLTFTLSREGMNDSGPLMPLSRVGTYVYTLSIDTIALRWYASNSLYTNHFYFNLDAETNELRMGNFYDSSKTMGQILTFTKRP